MSVAAWTAGAVIAVGVGELAVSQIEDGLGAGKQPLAADRPDVGALPVTPTKASSPGSRHSPSVSEATVERVLTSPGGTVVAQCRDAQAYLSSWSPAQGFRAHDVFRGPAAETRVEFESDSAEFVLVVWCISGVPHGSVQRDHHGKTDHDHDR